MHGRICGIFLIVALAVVAALSASPSASVAATAAQATPYPGGKWSPPAPAYGVVAMKDLRVKMRDGVELPVDVYVPADPKTGAPATGKFPVLLTRNWYTNVDDLMGGVQGAPGRGDYFVERGYIFVSADVRGTGRSRDPGAYVDERDAYDGVDLVKWAATLPAANGVVGLIGCSGLGITQLNTAGVLGPNSPVKAMIPACVNGDQYRDVYTEDGVWRPAWTGLLSLSTTGIAPAMAPEMLRTYLESQERGDAAYDRAWWAHRSYVTRAKQIADSGAAILLWNGWDDNGFGGLELYAALQNAAAGKPPTAPLWPGAPASGKYQLILGDWSHGGGLDQGVQLQWFETWLKGRDTGLPVRTRTPIHAQDRVTKDWLNLAAYPMVDRYEPLYLGAGTLSATVPEAGQDMLRWAATMPDAKDYTSEPFPEARRLAGPMAVRMEASSSNADAQFSFDLQDLAPDGSVTRISHGMVLASLYDPDPAASWRDKAGRPVRPFSRLKGEAPIKPGEVKAYEVHLEPTLWTVLPGHRLRLRVGTAAPPQDCASPAGRRGCRLTREQRLRLAGGVYTVLRGGAHPSMISLPFTPVRAFPAVRSGKPPMAPNVLPLDW